jgi:hypothetical protein
VSKNRRGDYRSLRLQFGFAGFDGHVQTSMKVLVLNPPPSKTPYASPWVPV